MSTRDIINAACGKVNQWHDSTYATKVIGDLEAAGYRILGPDELDGVTVTRCAAVATEWDNHEGYTHIGNEGIAAAIRSLKGGRS